MVCLNVRFVIKFQAFDIIPQLGNEKAFSSVAASLKMQNA